MDMGGANRKALENIFGKEVLQKLKSCEFYFKNCRNRHHERLGSSDDHAQFTELTDALLECVTQEAFENKYQDIIAFIDGNVQSRGSLNPWIQ